METISYNRMSGESKEAYKAFCTYRDCHPVERTVALVEERLKRSVGHWVRQYAWVERAEQWDDYCDRKKRAARAREFEERELEQFDGLRDFQNITLANIEIWQSMLVGAETEHAPTMSMEEIRRSLDAVIKLYRLMNSEATDIVENKENKPSMDLSKLTIKELQKLKDLQNKVRE